MYMCTLLPGLFRIIFFKILLKWLIFIDKFSYCFQHEGETDAAIPAFRPRSAKQALQPLLTEIEVYLHLLVLIYLIDNKKHTEAVQCSELLMAKLIPQNRRTLDMIAAKCYFYHSRAYELEGKLDTIRG